MNARSGIAADHGGFTLKQAFLAALKASGNHVVDFGAYPQAIGDDYRNYAIPLAEAISRGEVNRGLENLQEILQSALEEK